MNEPEAESKPSPLPSAKAQNAKAQNAKAQNAKAQNARAQNARAQNAKAQGDGAQGDSGVGNWGTRRQVEGLILMLAIGFGIYLCYLMVQPFVQAFAWALTLAILFAPFDRWLESRIRQRSVAALLAVVVIGVMVVVPAAFVAQSLVKQVIQGADMIEKRLTSGEWKQQFTVPERLSPWVDQFDQEFDLPGAISTLTAWLSNAAGSILKGSVFQLLGFVLVFYLLFFFLRDRDKALESLRSLSPLSPSEMDQLYLRVSDTVYATIYGTLAVAGVQGLLGGLMFWWLGLSAAFLWGLVMALLSVVPVLGAFVVWVPAALFLASEGHWIKALILALWGMMVVGTVDNLLRPMLVGNRLKMHTLLAFISVVGGLMLFGASGFILGPLVLTITTVLLEIWAARTQAVGPAEELPALGNTG